MSDTNKNKVVVRVEGGLVTDVYGSVDLPSDLQVIVLDYDNDPLDFDEDQKIAETEIDKNQLLPLW